MPIATLSLLSVDRSDDDGFLEKKFTDFRSCGVRLCFCICECISDCIFKQFSELFSVFIFVYCMHVYTFCAVHTRVESIAEHYICFIPTEPYSFCSMIDKQKRALGTHSTAKRKRIQKKQTYASHIQRAEQRAKRNVQRKRGSGKGAHQKFTRNGWFCQSFRNVKWICKRNCMHFHNIFIKPFNGIFYRLSSLNTSILVNSICNETKILN